MQQICNEYNEKLKNQPPPQPKPGRCTGCDLKFTEDDYCDGECPDCGYQTCESCSCHNSRGERCRVINVHRLSFICDKGTCYCPQSNFGNPYCRMDAQWYHGNGHTGAMYKGDRHPDEGYGYTDEDYEKEPRKCGNCGEVVRMIKPEFAKPH